MSLLTFRKYLKKKCHNYLMDLSLIPDTYTLGIDEHGNYTDIIPSIRHGIICPCAARKDKVYETTSKFNTHIKTKRHKKWVVDMNHNKANHYNELDRLLDPKLFIGRSSEQVTEFLEENILF